MNLNPFWSDQRIAELTRRWLEGQSYGVIAKALGTTRSAVAGIKHRLKLDRANFYPTIAVPYPERARTFKIAAKPARRPLMAKVHHSGSDGHPVSLMALTASMCRFPIGDPADPEFGFCGAPTYPGDSYCEKCQAICHVPAPKRARKAA